MHPLHRIRPAKDVLGDLVEMSEVGHPWAHDQASRRTGSERGSRFVERILTVVTTLKQQKRNPLELLTAALGAYLRGLPPPSLLPISTSTHSGRG